MKVRALKYCNYGGFERQIGSSFEFSGTDEELKGFKYLKAVAKDEPDMSVTAKLEQQEAETKKQHDAAVATSAEGVIAKAGKGKGKKPAAVPGQAPTAQVTEVGSQ